MSHKLVGFADSQTSSYIENQLLADRKSTRLNSSHGYISYAVFCLKKKIKKQKKKKKKKKKKNKKKKKKRCG